MAFSKTQAIKAVEAHGFSFIASKDGKLKFKSLHIDNDTAVDAYSYGLSHHDTFKPGEYTGMAHYSVYYIRTGEKNISIFFSYEDIRVYLCSLTDEKLRQDNERATAAELERIDQETQAHIESELAADSGERSDMWHIANNSYGGAPELSPDAAEPAPQYTDPIINEEPLNFNDNLGDKLSDLAKLHNKIIRAYSPDDLPSFTRYELVTVAELAVNDRVCFDHDRIIDQFHRVQSIVYCGAGNYSVVCDDTHYPYEVTRDTSVYRAIEPAPPHA